MTDWLSEFTKQVWTFDDYTDKFGYSCAYVNGKPQAISGHRGLIHSTEGSSWPTYQGGRVNPNFTVDPWKKQRRQHVPADIAARATVANNNAYVQIEIIGFCGLADAIKYGMEDFYLEKMGADELAYIAESLALIGKANNIPVESSLTWEVYPQSAWYDNGVRLTQDELNSYSGWLGHQHAPKPDVHGDPGAWPHTMDLFTVMQGEDPQPKPTPKPPAVATWYIGSKVQEAWARQLGTTPDGVISSQDSGNKNCFQVALWPCIEWVPAGTAKGSQLVKAFQRSHGLSADGIIGHRTMSAIQGWVGVPQDGVGGPITTKALCAKLGFK